VTTGAREVAPENSGEVKAALGDSPYYTPQMHGQRESLCLRDSF
jgi:hypothetical protein